MTLLDFNMAGTIFSRAAGTATDPYGNALEGTLAITGTTAVNCEIQQLRRSEPAEEGEMSVSEWVGFFPSGTSLDTSDQVICASAGGTFEVVGEPWDAKTGSPSVWHLESSLKRA